MIHIEKDQEVAGAKAIKVSSPSGDYEDEALIECYDATSPDAPTSAYQAQFVKYGSLVYQFNESAELGREILKLEPQSTHTAASYVRMTDELLAKMTGGSLEATSLNTALAGEQAAMEDQKADPQPPAQPQSIPETPSGVDAPPVAPDVSTTTPALLDTPPEATTTPALDVPAGATSTPDEASTSDQIVSLIKKKVAKKLLS